MYWSVWMPMSVAILGDLWASEIVCVISGSLTHILQMHSFEFRRVGTGNGGGR